MSTTRMERAGRRSKAGSLSGLSGGLGTPSAAVRRQRSLEWGGDRYSSSDDDRPPQPPPLADRVFASLLAQATQQFDNEQRRIYGSECGEERPRYVTSPQRQASPFPHESASRRYFRRNRNSKGEEMFTAEAGGTLSRRTRRPEEFAHDNNTRHRHDNGASNQGASERECDSPPEPAPPEVPPRGPSLHVTLRHRPAPPDQTGEPDRLYLSEEFVMSEGGQGTGSFPARSPMSSSTTGHSSSSHHRKRRKFDIFTAEQNTKSSDYIELQIESPILSSTDTQSNDEATSSNVLNPRIAQVDDTFQVPSPLEEEDIHELKMSVDVEEEVPNKTVGRRIVAVNCFIKYLFVYSYFFKPCR